MVILPWVVLLFKMDSTYNDVKIQMGYDTVPFVLNKPIYNLADVEFIQDEKEKYKVFEDSTNWWRDNLSTEVVSIYQIVET